MPTDAPRAAGSASAAATPVDVSHDGTAIDTIQSLIIAFVLAMTFRGFVTEGFVIPTGSMAPTLLGRHLLVHSPQTGLSYPVGLDQPFKDQRLVNDFMVDPMLGPDFSGSGPSGANIVKDGRMGDRILVLKCLYPFSEPKRFDVVVFKNPTDPIGDAANYIKRLIGLPNEQVWLTDGDVFARPTNGVDFNIQRKPEHVQRAVWQMVHMSDYVPTKPTRLNQSYGGPPWMSDAASWDLTGRSYVCSTEVPTELHWEKRRMEITDWAAYNMITERNRIYLPPVSDIRVSAGVVAKQPGLKMTFEIEARSHIFQYEIANGSATMRMKPLDAKDWTLTSGPAAVDLPAPGKVFDVEFWHADQSMRMFINGKPALDPIDYPWTANQRLAHASGGEATDPVDQLLDRPIIGPEIRWRFEGSPLTLHRVRLDRDLHYRRDQLDPRPGSQKNPPPLHGPAFGTHPGPDPSKHPAILNGDQFMMCGDNNSMSLDSRLWGNPHPLVKVQIGDDAPFLVNRKLLLGKAWVVYFPAPYGVVPDFGRLRFIR